MDPLAIAVRFGSYAILSLIAGVPLFLHLSLGGRRARMAFATWQGIFAFLLLAGAALALIGLLVATAAMAGTPLFPVDWDMVGIVLSATSSAKAMLARAMILFVLLLLLLLRHTPGLRSSILLGSIAAATLAWSGHAAAGDGALGWLHLCGDMLHILAAALWIGGMACLLASLRGPDAQQTAPMLSAFAWIGGLIVVLLVVTGLFNTAMTVGIANLAASLAGPYGKLLALKLFLFLLMLGLAANNRFRLTPRFERSPHTARPALRRAIAIELTLALVILALVGWLGMIDPLGKG
ncbi:copper homeostasis membrane protein CopD [Sphingobium sufflavum]|uniref:copper homeostasis membrane protein CopD n=1 Tax=Sphingobium sufflavum TaxID=1129547 RepID=UPI001F464D05|nr:copper homeostasis membrane protein CopD [Sphingobium sufflavum]MCE7796271.1 copper homeostasis membrane protein CopD [Sphingobium sufflavum]